MGRKNSKLKVKKRRLGELRNHQGIVIIILSITFATFLLVALLVAIFQPNLLDKIAEYAADFCKVTIGAIFGWLLHKSGAP